MKHSEPVVTVVNENSYGWTFKSLVVRTTTVVYWNSNTRQTTFVCSAQIPSLVRSICVHRYDKILSPNQITSAYIRVEQETDAFLVNEMREKFGDGSSGWNAE